MSTAIPQYILYALVPTSSIAATHAFASGSVGIATSKYCYPLTNHPNFDPGQTVIDQRKAIGMATRRTGSTGAGFEYQQGVKEPTTTWEFDANAYNLALPLWLLFQKGSAEGTTTAVYTKTFDAPTCTEGIEMETFANLLKRVECGSATTNKSQRIVGAVVRSVTLTAESNSPLSASVEFAGADFKYTGYDASGATLDFDTNDPLIWGASNADVEIGDAAIDVDSWDVTITNNIVAKQYEQNSVQKFIMQDFTAEGTVRIPWGASTGGGNAQVNNLIAGTPIKLEFFWGNSPATTSGDLAVQINARITGVEMATDDEVAQDVSFSAAYSNDSNPAIQITLVDAVDRGI